MKEIQCQRPYQGARESDFLPTSHGLTPGRLGTVSGTVFSFIIVGSVVLFTAIYSIESTIMKESTVSGHSGGSGSDIFFPIEVRIWY